MFELEEYFINKTILIETATQLTKDFSELGIQLELPENCIHPYDELFQKLLPIIDDLLHRKLQLLFNALYRIDISEFKLKKILSQTETTQQSAAITDLILRRELQKVVIRNHYKNGGNI